MEWHIKENDVPRNKLLDQGYRSVGDWHSTVKVGEGQSERAGRWAGKEKTECGLHKDYFVMKAQAKNAGMSKEPSALLSANQFRQYNPPLEARTVLGSRTARYVTVALTQPLSFSDSCAGGRDVLIYIHISFTLWNVPCHIRLPVVFIVAQAMT